MDSGGAGHFARTDTHLSCSLHTQSSKVSISPSYAGPSSTSSCLFLCHCAWHWCLWSYTNITESQPTTSRITNTSYFQAFNILPVLLFGKRERSVKNSLFNVYVYRKEKVDNINSTPRQFKLKWQVQIFSVNTKKSFDFHHTWFVQATKLLLRFQGVICSSLSICDAAASAIASSGSWLIAEETPLGLNRRVIPKCLSRCKPASMLS